MPRISIQDILPNPDSFIQLKIFYDKNKKLIISFLPQFEIDFALFYQGIRKPVVISGHMDIENFLYDPILQDYIFKDF